MIYLGELAVTKGSNLLPMDSAPADNGRGDPGSLDRLFPLVYRELHRLAHRCLRANRAGATMQTTALINEAYVRLVGGSASWNDRVHFLAIAARAMRMILVDAMRAQGRKKRGGGIKVTLEDAHLVSSSDDSLLALDEALTRLAEFDPRKSRVVELLYFGGLSWDEISAELGISVATVHRDLRMAKGWLNRELRAEAEGS